MGDSSDQKVLKSVQSKICTLPDPVLHHILSYLDMEEVVPTSLLSRRWRYLWISVPILNFCDTVWIKDFKHAITERRFMSFVDRVLLLHDNSNISRLQITCSSYYSSNRIDAWLAVAARRKFLEIHFALLIDQRMDLPHLLFSSSITVLELNGDVSLLNDASVAIPSWVCFSPLLKTLVLCNVKLPHGNSNGELVFSNPALENLTLKEFKQSHLNVLEISTHRLKNLVFENYKEVLAGRFCQNKICAPNLKSISMGGYWYYDCCLGDLPSLVRARFDFRGLTVYPRYLVNVLERVSCPATIELSGSVYFHDEIEDCLDELSQSYTNIRRLRFWQWGGRLIDCQESDQFLLNLLNIFPFLEALYLDGYQTELLEEEYLLPVTLHHLKYVEIGSVEVSGNELRFLKFLLKNAVILEKLVIVMDKQCKLETKRDFGDKIHSLERASPRLTLVLL